MSIALSNIKTPVSAACTVTSALGVGSQTDVVSASQSTAWTNGTGSGAVQLVYHATGTIGTSSNLDLDLYGTLLDKLGNTLNFSKVKAILIRNKGTTGGPDLHVTNGTNGFDTWLMATGDGVKVRCGGCMYLEAPLDETDAYGVTDATGDELRLTNPSGATTIDYEIVILGTGTIS